MVNTNLKDILEAFNKNHPKLNLTNDKFLKVFFII